MLLRTNVYDAIRAEILSCRFAPGEDMREQDLAARYEVSRQPVREALLRLEQDRLVTVLPRQGYRVNPISITDARDLLQMRLLLEPACGREVCATATAAQLAAFDSFRALGAAREFITYNRDFHVAVCNACGNRRMARATREIIEQSDRLTRVSLDSIRGRDSAQLVAEHGAIIDALQARDARRAASLLRDHITRAKRRIMAALSRAAIIAEIPGVSS
ncbi:MAG: GntR family transcriptional regulator [Methylobacteriaceae bacterium]|nr:GntR family transcriptional regulator [Methylobacteriaceae bacterium]